MLVTTSEIAAGKVIGFGGMSSRCSGELPYRKAENAA
jgi:hypothetical protein